MLLCNHYLCFSWLCSISMFVLVVFVVFRRLWFWLSLLVSFFFIVFFIFFFIIFFMFFLLSFFFLSIIFIFLLIPCSHSSCKFPPLVFPSLNHLCYCSSSSFLFSFLWLISSNCSGCCLFVLIRPLSHLLFVLLPSCRHLKKKTTQRTIISFCLPMCFCAKNSFQTSSFIFFFCGFPSFTKHVCFHKTCLFHFLGICFQGVWDSLLFLICCDIVVLLFR